MNVQPFILSFLLSYLFSGSGLILKSEAGSYASYFTQARNTSSTRPDTLNSELVITLTRAQIDPTATGLRIILQDETTGESRPLSYDPKTRTARASVVLNHRYTVAIDAPGYTPYRKYIDKVQPGQALGVQLTPTTPPQTNEKKYTLIVMDKEQRSVVPGADLRVFDANRNPVSVVTNPGQYLVILPETGTFSYEVTAPEYQSVRGILERSGKDFIEIGLVRKRSAPQTQTIAFVAQDAFTKKPIAARFRLNSPETNTSATLTTVRNPEFGTELKLQHPYLLEVESEGYVRYAAPITLNTIETEPIKPRVVFLDPLTYTVSFTILDAVTMKPIDPASFKVGDSGKTLNVQRVGSLRKTSLSAGKQYELQVGQPGYELFDRTLTFDKPTGPNDLLKSILLSPVQAETKSTSPGAVAKSSIPSTPEVAKVDESIFENLKIGEAVRLDNVYFDQSSYILRTESHRQLDKLVKTLKVNTQLKIEIAGHTDNVGDARLNQYLSENRARVISSYLANKGISKERLLPKGYGPTKPVAANDTEENKAQNRRVEFVVLEK